MISGEATIALDLIDALGTLSDVPRTLYEMIDARRKEEEQP